MHRKELLQLLTHYRTPFMEEAGMVARAIAFVRQHVNCFDRHLETGHVTGSSWVVNPSRSRVLLLHHRKLDRWLQPGGHADGDPDMLRVVLKETAEETGLEIEQIHLVAEQIFDVDIHTIYPSAHDALHTHFDVRFLVEIDDAIPLPGNNESYDVRWVALHEVAHYNNALSLHRMVRKTRQLAAWQA